MAAVGEYSLTKNSGASDLTITAAGTSICDTITDLDGAIAVTLSARLSVGSGGTTCKAFIQTLFGDLWVDIACFAFTTSTAHRLFNLSGLTAITSIVTPTDGTMSDNTVQDGLLGGSLRAKIITTGTYAGSTVISIRAMIR
jgi:hypothetical protein